MSHGKAPVIFSVIAVVAIVGSLLAFGGSRFRSTAATSTPTPSVSSTDSPTLAPSAVPATDPEPAATGATTITSTAPIAPTVTVAVPTQTVTSNVLAPAPPVPTTGSPSYQPSPTPRATTAIPYVGQPCTASQAGSVVQVDPYRYMVCVQNRTGGWEWESIQPHLTAGAPTPTMQSGSPTLPNPSPVP